MTEDKIVLKHTIEAKNVETLLINILNWLNKNKEQGQVEHIIVSNEQTYFDTYEATIFYNIQELFLADDIYIPKEGVAQVEEVVEPLGRIGQPVVMAGWKK